jgi:hypothetical protein
VSLTAFYYDSGFAFCFIKMNSGQSSLSVLSTKWLVIAGHSKILCSQVLAGM